MLYTSIKRGHPLPLGATKSDGGFNFSIYSRNIVQYLLVAPVSNPSNILKIPLDPVINRTGTVYHIFLECSEPTLYYSYIVDYEGKETVCIDPYARIIDSNNQFGNNYWNEVSKGTRLYSLTHDKSPFDWKDDVSPTISLDQLIIYEMHVRGFTKDPSSHVSFPGTYKSFIEKIPYLKDLGITAVELLPIQEFDESEYLHKNPITKEKLCNYWGYSPLSFLAPMMRYSSSKDPTESVNEFKAMIKELHKAGIKVIIDIVFNHTGEGNEYGRVISWKGFSESDYYLLDENKKHMNFSGCGNTFHCNHPIVGDLLIEALRYWVYEYHVDGFRFDLAAIFARGPGGRPLIEPPFIERITQDPLLENVLLIAEPWDATGLHQVGAFFQSSWEGYDRWMEWNDDFRITTRRFIKGTDEYAGKFATKLSGSEDVYGKGGSPLNSINFITCHDGFTLRDLVSYNYKHNEENGEDNRDGSDGNDSWNCGDEGESSDPEILRLRDRQMRNLAMALFLAQGIPMLLMGDEYGHTKNGNNNTWCHDNKLNWFLWDERIRSSSFFRFMKLLIAFRKSHLSLHHKAFLTKTDIEWHGVEPFCPDWSSESRFVAFSLKNFKEFNELYIAFNADYHEKIVNLPHPSYSTEWCWIIDTQKLPPEDFIEAELEHKVVGTTIKMAPHSAMLLLSQKKM